MAYRICTAAPVGRSTLLLGAAVSAAAVVSVSVSASSLSSSASSFPLYGRYTSEEVRCATNSGSGREKCEAIESEAEAEAEAEADSESYDYGYEYYDDAGVPSSCYDEDDLCEEWASEGECDDNPEYMLNECRRACFACVEDTGQYGVLQNVPAEDDPLHDATVQLIDNSTAYMQAVWRSGPEHERVRHKCRNQDERCSYWAAEGECDANPDFMSVQCAPACQKCHLLDNRLRCPIEEGNECIWKPGDLNALFENIVDDADGSGAYARYNPKALSRPKPKSDGTPAPNVDEDGPWIVTLENFITDEEADALIAAGALVGYERSSDVGKELPDGSYDGDVNEGRTSHNAWCSDETCGDDAVISPVIERIANVTGTHVQNSEDIQLLRYEPGQFYNQHHDYIEHQAELPCGPRILTLFLYLNDVEEGGGTHFSLLDLTVHPKKGDAVLWPSVLDESPEEKDERTDHEALPVLRGIKYGANSWIHSRNFMQASDNGCS